jgi:hypothetical protein
MQMIGTGGDDATHKKQHDMGPHDMFLQLSSFKIRGRGSGL